MLAYSNLHFHQTFIKNIPLMKRESNADTLHPTRPMMNFSFGEYFDEKMMRYYRIVYQRLNISIHQFIVFSFIINP